MAKPRVRVALGTLLVLAASSIPQSARADAPPLRLIDVVEVAWPGATATGATGNSVSDVIRNDTIARWRALSADRVVFTFDQLLPTVTMPAAMPCDAQGSISFLGQVALSAYTKAGFPDWSNRYLVVIAPAVGSCIWAGRGVINPPGSTAGMLILNGTDNAFVIAHELGHNLGLGHSNLETCATGKADGPWAECSAVEYGSATDLMGNLDRSSPLSVYHQWRLGLIPDSDVTVADRNLQVSLSPVNASAGTRAIFLRDGPAAYWVEYRTADPVNGIRAGLVVYRSDPPPASSIVSPFGSDAAALSTELTTDVWMISLDDYQYNYPPTGSPSLPVGAVFTTAYGNVTVKASASPDGTLSVAVVRSRTQAPAAPLWTDRSTWTGPASPITRTDFDNEGVAIARFEARITTDTTTVTLPVAASSFPLTHRTFLMPLGSPVAVRADALPEGRYTLAIRAVTTTGTAGPWSTPRVIAVDHGAPVVHAAFSIGTVQPQRAVSVRWTGARDAGVGVCAARAYSADGFATLQWASDAAAVPTFTLANAAGEQYSAVVQDCFGNPAWGSLTLTSAWLAPSTFTHTGAWSGAPRARCTRGTCTASLRTGAGSTAFVVGRGAATFTIDGGRSGVISRSASAAARVVLRVDGAHSVTIKTSDLELLGAQSVRANWVDTATVAANSGVDDSLADDAQAALSRLGFSQTDFLPGTSVLPIGGGTTTDGATLDLCNADFPSEGERQTRRQVAVTGPIADSYLFLSSETVRYWSAEAAHRALTEVDAAAALCTSRGYAISAAGIHEPYTFHTLPPLPAGLRPAADRRIFCITIGEGQAARTALIIYQVRGDVLSALYAVRHDANAIPGPTVSRWLQVATVLAARLNRMH